MLSSVIKNNDGSPLVWSFHKNVSEVTSTLPLKRQRTARFKASHNVIKKIVENQEFILNNNNRIE
jgi:hypothetical protein